MIPVAHRLVAKPKDLSTDGFEVVRHAAMQLASCLWANGQLWSNSVLSRTEDRLELVAEGPTRSALHDSYASPLVLRARAELDAVCEEASAWTSVGIDVLTRTTTEQWSDCTSFAMSAHMNEETSPVKAREGEEPVPLFLLPIEPETREELMRWYLSYQRHDAIWIESGGIEKAAASELTLLESSLNTEGLRLAEVLRTQLNADVYYSNSIIALKEYSRSKTQCALCLRPWDSGSGDGPLTCHRCFITSSVDYEEFDGG